MLDGRGDLGRKGIKGVMKVRGNGVGRKDVEEKNTKSVMG